MFTYYFWLGLRALRRHRWLTGLTVMILSVGVAVSIAALTILHLMSADPLPFKSDRVLTTVLDNGPSEGYRPGDQYVDHQMSYIDLMALLERAPAMRKAGMYAVQSPVEMPRKELGVLSGMGVAGTLALIWSSLGVFGALTSAVNEAWGVEKRRSYLKHRLVSFLMLVAAGLLMVASLLLVMAVRVAETSWLDRKSTRLNSSHSQQSRMPSSA